MTKQLLINGEQNFMGVNIPIIEGGFGESQKCVTPHSLSKIHNMEVREINQAIKRLIDKGRIKENVHYIDILNNNFNITVGDLGITLSNNAKNYYLLSERGYSSLIKYMDDDMSWDVMDKFVDEYFTMRKVIEQISEKDRLLLGLFSDDKMVVAESHKQLVQIEVKEAVKPLEEKIENDKPLVEFGNQVLKSADNILVRELSKLAFEQGIDIGEKKLYKKLREWKYIMQGCTEPYQSSMNQGLFLVEEKSINTPYGVKLTKTTKVTPKGQVFIIEKLRKEMVSK